MVFVFRKYYTNANMLRLKGGVLPIVHALISRLQTKMYHICRQVRALDFIRPIGNIHVTDKVSTSRCDGMTSLSASLIPESPCSTKRLSKIFIFPSMEIIKMEKWRTTQHVYSRETALHAVTPSKINMFIACFFLPPSPLPSLSGSCCWTHPPWGL